jgi:hypothetical protein
MGELDEERATLVLRGDAAVAKAEESNLVSEAGD